MLCFWLHQRPLFFVFCCLPGTPTPLGFILRGWMGVADGYLPGAEASSVGLPHHPRKNEQNGVEVAFMKVMGVGCPPLHTPTPLLSFYLPQPLIFHFCFFMGGLLTRSLPTPVPNSCLPSQINPHRPMHTQHPDPPRKMNWKGSMRTK